MSKEFFKQILSDCGSVSSMRIMSFVSLAVGSLLALIGLLRGANLAELSLLCGVFIGSAFGGKAMQKFAELRAPVEEEKHD